MSSTLIQYQCRKCKHIVGLGFRGEHNFFGLICRDCDRSCYAYPPHDETIWESEGPYQLSIMGYQWIESSSKKGRVKKRVRRQGWEATDIQVPTLEDIRQVGEKLYIQYPLNLEDVPCPFCAQYSLCHELDYVKTCPNCGSDKMEEQCL